LENAPVRQWTFLMAFPVKWTGPTVQSTATEVAVESLEFAHEGLLA
jgi:phage tail-like protein